MTKSQYRVDLAAQMADCDSNYLKIMKLFPNLYSRDNAEDSRDRLDFYLPAADGNPIPVNIDVIEKAKYTSTVAVYQGNTQLPWMPPSHMTIRIYHDARTAELVSFQQQRHFKPRYTIPNEQSFHRDEKAQLNRFLGEWLSHCLEYGFANVEALYPNHEKCD